MVCGIMRLGLNGCFLPANMDDITPGLCERVRGFGFSGIFTRFRENDRVGGWPGVAYGHRAT